MFDVCTASSGTLELISDFDSNQPQHFSVLCSARPLQATLERDGALAGQEVKADVLRMEIGALEGELRRARQELGASEVGRREVRHRLICTGVIVHSLFCSGLL